MHSLSKITKMNLRRSWEKYRASVYHSADAVVNLFKDTTESRNNTILRNISAVTPGDLNKAALIKRVWEKHWHPHTVFKLTRKQGTTSLNWDELISVLLCSLDCIVLYCSVVIFDVVRGLPSHRTAHHVEWGGCVFFLSSICSATLLKVRLDLYLPSHCLVAKGLYSMNYAQYFAKGCKD